MRHSWMKDSKHVHDQCMSWHQLNQTSSENSFCSCDGFHVHTASFFSWICKFAFFDSCQKTAWLHNCLRLLCSLEILVVSNALSMNAFLRLFFTTPKRDWTTCRSCLLKKHVHCPDCRCHCPFAKFLHVMPLRTWNHFDELDSIVKPSLAKSCVADRFAATFQQNCCQFWFAWFFIFAGIFSGVELFKRQLEDCNLTKSCLTFSFVILCGQQAGRSDLPSFPCLWSLGFGHLGFLHLGFLPGWQIKWKSSMQTSIAAVELASRVANMVASRVANMVFATAVTAAAVAVLAAHHKIMVSFGLTGSVGWIKSERWYDFHERTWSIAPLAIQILYARLI